MEKSKLYGRTLHDAGAFEAIDQMAADGLDWGEINQELRSFGFYPSDLAIDYAKVMTARYRAQVEELGQFYGFRPAER